MALINELLGGRTLVEIDRPYWAAKLDDDRWLCEASTRVDIRAGRCRLVDWTLDLVSTDDLARVRELWLLCPGSKLSPMGNTVRMPILAPYTAFQFKCALVDATPAGAVAHSRMAAMLIGRLDDVESGECTCFVWDAQMQALYHSWKTNVYAPSGMGTWRSGGIPIPRQSLAVLGIKEP